MNKNIYILFMLMWLCALTSQAQQGLEIDRIFKDLHRADNVTETIVSGGQLKGTGLTYYRSIIVSGDVAKNCTEAIVKAVLADGALAVNKEVSSVDGHLFYAQYTLRPSGGRNRYIFYVDNTLKGDPRVMLVFMEGKATLEEVRRLIKKK